MGSKYWPRSCAMCWRAFRIPLPWYLRKSTWVDTSPATSERVPVCRSCHALIKAGGMTYMERELRASVGEFVDGKSDKQKGDK